MRQLSSLALLLSVCSYLTQAQVPFPGECPTNVKAMEVFDLDAYTGVWYEYTKYPFVFEVGKKCIYARYGNNGNNTVSVQNFSINRITNTPSNIKGTARVLAPATLAVQFSPFQPADKPNYVVLGTDYTSYAVVYSCTSLGTFAHTKVVWILTRDRQPSEAAIKIGKDIMDANKLSQTYLIDTLQTDCPAVTDDNSSTSNSNDGDTVAQLNNAISRG